MIPITTRVYSPERGGKKSAYRRNGAPSEIGTAGDCIHRDGLALLSANGGSRAFDRGPPTVTSNDTKDPLQT